MNETIEKQQIKEFANRYGYSDVEPYEVVKVISNQTVEIRAMDTEQTVFPKQFHIGGFSAHCSDNRNQDYKYISNPDNPVYRIRWSKANRNWYSAGGNKHLMEKLPSKFYDYNF